MVPNIVNPLEDDEPPKKKLVVFFLVDTSGSMDGDRIGQVNNAVKEALPEIRNLGGADADIYFAPLTFGATVNWVYAKPEPVATATWKSLDADGMTPLGEAFNALNLKLSRNEFLASPSGSFAPVIFLLTDGYPNDDWEAGLKKLKNNSWFKKSLKIGVGIGNDSDMSMIREFCSDRELAINLTNGEDLGKMVKFILVTSSEIGSRSVGVEDLSDVPEEEENKTKQDAMIDQLKNFKSQDYDDLNTGF